MVTLALLARTAAAGGSAQCIDCKHGGSSSSSSSSSSGDSDYDDTDTTYGDGQIHYSAENESWRPKSERSAAYGGTRGEHPQSPLLPLADKILIFDGRPSARENAAMQADAADHWWGNAGSGALLGSTRPSSSSAGFSAASKAFVAGMPNAYAQRNAKNITKISNKTLALLDNLGDPSDLIASVNAAGFELFTPIADDDDDEAHGPEPGAWQIFTRWWNATMVSTAGE